MIRVIIVDDENIVRLGLRSLIDWEANGFDIIGLFENGEDALSYCCNSGDADKNPQVIITDIKMPEMNGITLIKKVKRILPEAKFIVLSNYNDFELVTEAFKEGATDYLLKQFIEPDKILSILNGIKEGLIKDGVLQNDSMKLDSNKVRKQKKEEFLFSILRKSNMSEDEYREKGHDFGINFDPSGYLCLKIHYYKPSKNCSDVNEPLVDSVVENILNVSSELCAKYGNYDMLVVEDCSLMILISLFEQCSDELIYPKLADVARDISDSLKLYFGVESQISSSTPHSGLSNVSHAYRQAGTALNMSFYYLESRFYYYGCIEILTDLPDDLEAKGREITQALNVYDFKKVSYALDELFMLLENGIVTKTNIFISPNIIKQLFINKIIEVKECILSGYKAGVQDFYNDDYQDLLDLVWKSECLSNLKNSVMEYIGQAAGYVENHQASNGLILSVKDYISNNYNQRISLENIAAHFYINPNYLSYLFKEKTGEYFSNYLRRIKIEKAIGFMSDRYLSIEEVAEMVGYDSNYFIKAFKKVTNMTVSEFRKHCQ